MTDTTTTRTVTVEQAERNLRSILNALSEDELITVVDKAGTPVAQISASENRLDPEVKDRKRALKKWTDSMREFAQSVQDEWDGEKSLLEQLDEDRSRMDRLFGPSTDDR